MIVVKGEEVSQAGWQALAEALEAVKNSVVTYWDVDLEWDYDVEENPVGMLRINNEAAVIGSRLEVGRCLAKVEKMSIGQDQLRILYSRP